MNTNPKDSFNPSKPTSHSESFQMEIPNPWLDDTSPNPNLTVSFDKFPIDPSHELTAAAVTSVFLAPEGDPTALQIPAHTSCPAVASSTVLLQDELKLKASKERNLWDHMQDAFTLLLWREACEA
jgi:hypothetical protein